MVFKPQCFSGVSNIQRLILLMGGVKKISVQNIGSWVWHDSLSRLSKQIHFNWHIMLCLSWLTECYQRVKSKCNDFPLCYCTIKWIWTLFTLWGRAVPKNKFLNILFSLVWCCMLRKSCQLLRALGNKGLSCILLQHVCH